MSGLHVAEILEKSAEVLERDGWCQHTFTDHTGARCAVGAIRQGFMEASASNTPLIEARRQLARYLRIGVLKIVDWNDASDRTAAEVIDAFRLAAKDVRNEAKPE